MADVKQLTSDELARVQLADGDEWFLENGGSPIGPLSTAEVKERWLAHQLGPESRCWGVGFPGWVPLVRISALTRALGTQLQQAAIPAPEPVPVKPPEPEAAPALSPRRRSQPLAFHVEPASPPRALRSIAGAAVGLCAVAALTAVIAGPPLLSPPAPQPITTMPPLPDEVALLAPPAPVAPRRQAPERRAKKPAPAPAVEEAPLRPSKPKARLDAGDVMAVVRAHRAEIMKCREAALAEDPTLSGQKLLVQWTVSPEGLPRDVEALPSQLQDFELSSCVTRAIEGWKFPQHAAEQAPRITFPFVF